MLDLSTVLRLAKNEHELARLDEDESVECILATRDTDVLMLIEDEILLSLPISPATTEGECSIASLEGRGIARGKAAFCRIGGTEKTALNLFKELSTWQSNKTKNLRPSAACTARMIF